MNEQTLIWGTFCLLALAAAILWPRLTRRFLGGFFILMALGVNLVYVLVDPAGFVGIGTDAPLLGIYAWAFSTIVAVSPVTLGITLAIYELALGTCMIIGGRAARWGLLAGIAFLVASTPLSTWTLPNLILAAALLVILRREPRSVAATTSAGGISRTNGEPQVTAERTAA
ncbi:MAG: hypothetical protein LCH96_02280 [Actinobacteria bacterium]|nr:hypothetical protein [Actinomycetota bacterium]